MRDCVLNRDAWVHYVIKQADNWSSPYSAVEEVHDAVLARHPRCTGGEVGATAVGAPASVGATVGATIGAATVGALVSASPKRTRPKITSSDDPPYASRLSCIKVRLN